MAQRGSGPNRRSALEIERRPSFGDLLTCLHRVDNLELLTSCKQSGGIE
jgi:hypothetical protein